MHQISQQTAEAAQKHALQSKEHGKSVEEVGKRLLEDDLMEPVIGQSIEASGRTIQKKSQQSLDLAQELAENGSTEVFAESIQAHVEATENHIEATREFQRGLQAHLDLKK